MAHCKLRKTEIARARDSGRIANAHQILVHVHLVKLIPAYTELVYKIRRQRAVKRNPR